MPGKTISNERVDAAVREAVAARLVGDSPRKEKSRLAASILFFEHGVYPSAKAVLECTQQGSLTDINRDVQEFWRDLREKTKVHLDAPALPDDLLASFSEGLRAVWDLANSKANEGLDALRRDAEDKVSVSEQRVDEARRAQLLVEARIQEVEQELRGERERREAAETRAEVQSAEIESLNNSIEQWRSRLADETSARREAEERFSRDRGLLVFSAISDGTKS
ncbi:DNA-binding protein [Hydrogenophaga defluvii]|uniref:DNA-binding protein n=1 Tax=Hydrogenophaga defluvii TaxID=249410 RepID=A0ABW2SF29_9BURK